MPPIGPCPERCQDLIVRFWRKVDQTTTPDGCWEWTGAYSRSSTGRKDHRPPRPVFWIGRLTIDGERVMGSPQLLVPAARMALTLTDGVSLDQRVGLEACHKPPCTNTRCVRPDHLYWGTPEENRADRYPPTRPAWMDEHL